MEAKQQTTTFAGAIKNIFTGEPVNILSSDKLFTPVALPKSVTKKDVRADFTSSGGSYNFMFAVSYNGEKNLGEIGPIKNYRLDYTLLRMRSWQSYHESEITQTIMNRYNMWLVGKGLKLQSEPVKEILASEGITLDVQKFSRTVETRWRVWSHSKSSDYSGMENIHFHAATGIKNSMLGGDVLVIMRYGANGVNVQLVDGAHLQSPQFGSEWFPEKLANGNRIINGIELDVTGQHIRYFIRNANFTFTVVEAKGTTSGLQMAFLVYGLKYRLDNTRGVPLFAVVLETLKKLERYKEATVGSAEERQKIVMQIVHGIGSTGENPQNKNLAKAHDINAGANTEIPRDQQGKEIANTIAVTTNKQVFNMPIDSKLESPVDSKNELYFKDFYSTNFDIICGALAIPPNVASSKYDANFSASRAALKDWEHTLSVKRNDIAFQYYQPIFNFWLECEILNNKIDAPGYLLAKFSNNNMVLDAYRTARFIGAPVPHIDPLKEVKAEREKLGISGYAIPLTTAEAAAESLGGAEYEHISEQYAEELANSIKLKLVAPVTPVAPPIPTTA